MPMSGMKMASMAETASMEGDCPDRADVSSAPAGDGTGTPVDQTMPDCCQAGACQCANAHGAFATVAPVVRARPATMATSVLAVGDSSYSSPALARLVRPPISR